MSHLIAGFPDAETSVAIADALVKGGANILEIQLAFSDPSADGPAIQTASTIALESAHAGAAAMKIAKELPKDKALVINMSGRGDKDIFITSPVFRPEKWKEFLKAELKRLENNEDIHDAEIMNK